MMGSINNEFYTEEDLRKMGFKSVGSDVRVSKLAVIRYPEETSIGNHVAIDPFDYVSVKMDIGNHVHIGANCNIIGSIKSYLKMCDYSGLSSGVTVVCGSDDFKEYLTNPTVPMKYRKVTFGKVILEKYVVIGADSTIFPNVTIGEGTAVGAKSLVTKSLEPWKIYVGNPVKRVGDRRRELIKSYAKEIEGKLRKFDLIVVCSITDQKCFEKCLSKALEKIGCQHKLILTNPNLSLSESYNSIVETNLEDIKQSKYLVFAGQDMIVKGKNWGDRLVSTCDSLQDFGYGGVECMLDDQQIGHVKHGKENEPAMEVTCCDGGVIIIPSKIFLEHQFDTRFKWYPLAEDYVCWLRFVKGLKVYHVPIEGFISSSKCRKSGFVTRFPNVSAYWAFQRDEHLKLLQKWKLKKLTTTSMATNRVFLENT